MDEGNRLFYPYTVYKGWMKLNSKRRVSAVVISQIVEKSNKLCRYIEMIY